jgi:hypothetical protein
LKQNVGTGQILCIYPRFLLSLSIQSGRRNFFKTKTKTNISSYPKFPLALSIRSGRREKKNNKTIKQIFVPIRRCPSPSPCGPAGGGGESESNTFFESTFCRMSDAYPSRRTLVCKGVKGNVTA